MLKFLPPLLRRRASVLRWQAGQLSLGGSWALTEPEDVQHNLRNFWLDGLFASAHDAIVLTYLVLYVLALGANEMQIGILSALGSLAATLVLLPGAVLVERWGRRKQIVVATGGVTARLMILLLALAPFAAQGQALILLAIGLEVLRQAFGSLALPAWVSLSGDLVPIAWRGRYFASRNIVMSLANIVIVISTGQLITRFNAPGGYQAALGLAFVFGILSAYFFSRLKETPLEPIPAAQRATFSPAFFRPLAENRALLMLCATAAIWNFGLNLSGPFFNVYMARELLLTPAMIGLLATVSSLSGLPGQRVLGPLVDRLGPRRVQLLTGFLIPLLPLSWVWITRPAWAPWQITLVNLVGGFLWAGYSLASFNLLLALTPAEQRARASAIYQVIVSISLAAGAAVGGVMVSAWGYAVIFLASALMRWVAAGLFARYVK